MASASGGAGARSIMMQVRKADVANTGRIWGDQRIYTHGTYDTMPISIRLMGKSASMVSVEQRCLKGACGAY